MSILAKIFRFGFRAINMQTASTFPGRGGLGAQPPPPEIRNFWEFLLRNGPVLPHFRFSPPLPEKNPGYVPGKQSFFHPC